MKARDKSSTEISLGSKGLKLKTSSRIEIFNDSSFIQKTFFGKSSGV